MNDDTPYNEFDEFDDFEPEDRELHDEYGDFHQSAYDRWRPALIAFAVLLTVIAVAVVGNGDNDSSTELSNPDVVVESTNVPLVTVPLTRTLKTGMKGGMRDVPLEDVMITKASLLTADEAKAAAAPTAAPTVPAAPATK